jgi:HEAT repeat protein
MADTAAVPVLLDLLGDPDDFVQGVAATVLGEVHPPERIVPALVALLDDRNARRRSGACRVLHYFGPAAKKAVPALVSALQDENARVRLWAAAALGEMAPDSGEAVSTLIATVADEDEDEEVCGNAVVSLRKIGTMAPAAVPALSGALHRRECSMELVKAIVTVLLENFGGEGACALAAAYPGLAHGQQVAVVGSLEELSGKSKDGIQPLSRITTDPKVRSTAIEVLGHIKPPSHRQSADWPN